MKKWIISLIVLIGIFLPGYSSAAGSHDLCYAAIDQAGVEVVNTVSASRAQGADLFATDFEPDVWDDDQKNHVKFSIQLTPETAAAITKVQCDIWNGTTTVTADKIINGGTALPAGATYDFDLLVHPKTLNCNLVATSGGTQDWTAEICKSFNSQR